jgi:nucleoid-associated protein YgaU
MTKQNPKISFSTTPVEFGASAQKIKTADLSSEPVGQKRQVVRIPMTVDEEPPVAPGFAETGLMGRRDPSLFASKGRILGVVAVAVGAFVLGLLTVFWFVADGDATPIAATGPTQGSSLAVNKHNPGSVATRAASADLTDVGGAVPSSMKSSVSEQDLVKVALEQLKPRVVAVAPESNLVQSATDSLDVLQPNALRILREGVLAGTYKIEMVEDKGIERLRLRPLSASASSPAMVDTLINAADAGRIDMADALRTPEGKVDTDTMIFSLVQNSLLGDQTSESTNAAHGMSRKVFAASNVGTTVEDGVRVYTVRAGDSLAYISLQFFGVLGAYTRILEANRDTLQSPDKIQVGQRLIIPS